LVFTMHYGPHCWISAGGGGQVLFWHNMLLSQQPSTAVPPAPCCCVACAANGHPAAAGRAPTHPKVSGMLLIAVLRPEQCVPRVLYHSSTESRASDLGNMVVLRVLGLS
jgi:hypothetical protein